MPLTKREKQKWIFQIRYQIDQFALLSGLGFDCVAACVMHNAYMGLTHQDDYIESQLAEWIAPFHHEFLEDGD